MGIRLPEPRLLRGRPPESQAQDPLTHLVLGEGGGIREHGQKWIVQVEPERLVQGR